MINNLQAKIWWCVFYTMRFPKIGFKKLQYITLFTVSYNIINYHLLNPHESKKYCFCQIFANAQPISENYRRTEMLEKHYSIKTLLHLDFWHNTAKC